MNNTLVICPTCPCLLQSPGCYLNALTTICKVLWFSCRVIVAFFATSVHLRHVQKIFKMIWCLLVVFFKTSEVPSYVRHAYFWERILQDNYAADSAWRVLGRSWTGMATDTVNSALTSTCKTKTKLVSLILVCVSKTLNYRHSCVLSCL